jgi:hypothetical protein
MTSQKTFMVRATTAMMKAALSQKTNSGNLDFSGCRCFYYHTTLSSMSSSNRPLLPKVTKLGLMSYPRQMTPETVTLSERNF